MTTTLIFPTVAVIGLGLIGGSMAKRIRASLPDTTLYALDTPEILTQATADGVVDKPLAGLTDPMLLEADLILLGTHLAQSYAILATLAQTASRPIQVMDLGSAKGPICQLADTLPDTLGFIGGHPLAGREVSGYANSLDNLFWGKRFLLTPCQKTPPDFQAQVTAWLIDLGMSPAVIAHDTHDRLMSLVSHFPQFYAVALANLLQENDPEEALHFLGGGIDDQMRLMASPYEMWRDVFQDNRTNLGRILDQFIGMLTEMRNALATDDMQPWFENSHRIYGMYQQNKPSGI